MFNVKEQEVRGDGYTVKLAGGAKTQRLEIVKDGERMTLVFDALGWLLTTEKEYDVVEVLPL